MSDREATRRTAILGILLGTTVPSHAIEGATAALLKGMRDPAVSWAFEAPEQGITKGGPNITDLDILSRLGQLERHHSPFVVARNGEGAAFRRLRARGLVVKVPGYGPGDWHSLADAGRKVLARAISMIG